MKSENKFINTLGGMERVGCKIYDGRLSDKRKKIYVRGIGEYMYSLL